LLFFLPRTQGLCCCYGLRDLCVGMQNHSLIGIFLYIYFGSFHTNPFGKRILSSVKTELFEKVFQNADVMSTLIMRGECYYERLRAMHIRAVCSNFNSITWLALDILMINLQAITCKCRRMPYIMSQVIFNLSLRLQCHYKTIFNLNEFAYFFVKTFHDLCINNDKMNW
jgi:hypothetical protein